MGVSSQNNGFLNEAAPLGPQPSAPPQPTNFHYPPPPPPAPPTTTTAIGIPMNSRSQFDGPNYNYNNTVNNESKSAVPWSTGLCGCFEDVSSCCLTCWCPCITFGRIAEITDRGSTSCGVSGALYTLITCVTGCACLYSCFYRSKMRGQYFLEGSSCMDCCIHCWCEECALCQEYRELKNRGFDMSVGWHGNIERQQRLKGTTAPVVQGGMAR